MAAGYEGLLGPKGDRPIRRATAFETRKAHQAAITEPGVDERGVVQAGE